MRKKLLILALLLITGLLPASSYTIKLKNKGDLQNGSLRVPPTALISADYDEGVTIQRKPQQPHPLSETDNG